MAKKDTPWICPNCGGDRCLNPYTDYDDNYVIKKMFCGRCRYDWREYFYLTYDGYSDDTGEYEKDGTESEY